MDSIGIQQMRDIIGIESTPRTFVAEAGAIRRFAEAVGDTSTRYRDGAVAPPTFLRSFDLVPPVPEFDIPYPDILDGGSEWDFVEAVRADDEIAVTSKVVDVQEKSGSLGDMLFISREHSYMNQHKKLAAVQTSTTIYYTATTPPRQAQSKPPRERGPKDRGTTAHDAMGQKVYIEDLSEGTHIRTITKIPTTRQLVQYAGASGDFYEIHYDQEFAESTGLPDVIVHGALKSAFLAQMLTDWIGERGTLRALSAQYRGMDAVGLPIHCKGVVTAVGDHIHERGTDPQGESGQDVGSVRCDVWTETEAGVKTTVGTAVVTLPSRGKL